MKSNKPALYKSNKKMKGERLTVKTFTSEEAKHAFLNKQDNNDWKELKGTVCGAELPARRGTYAYAGGAWHNTKSLDPCVLAHI